MHPIHDIETGPAPPDRLNAFIEIPRGERNKYEIDKETGVLRYDRLLHSAVHYPGDYGFIPRTLAEDGDALDILVLITSPTVPGCLIEVRPVGMFEMRDEKGRDVKVLAVPFADPFMEGYHELEDVPAHTLREIDHFSRSTRSSRARRRRPAAGTAARRPSKPLATPSPRTGRRPERPEPTLPLAGSGPPRPPRRRSRSPAARWR